MWSAEPTLDKQEVPTNVGDCHHQGAGALAETSLRKPGFSLTFQINDHKAHVNVKHMNVKQ